MAPGPYFAGIELGGTKSIAVLARNREIVARTVVPTKSPRETQQALSAQLEAWAREPGFAALGIAYFGPLQLAAGAPGFGTMLPTPKQGWGGAPVADMLAGNLGCPWLIDTDVNAAALAEYLWGAGFGRSSICYITIGTGVGGGLVIDGKPVHGAMHPEIGHLKLRRADGDTFAGLCAFHGDCIEGLVSGPALAVRLGADPATIADDDPRWGMVASDLAELVCAMLLTTSAQRVLIGGGVGMARERLLPKVRALAIERLGGYLPFFDKASANDVIRLPSLGNDAGPLGAIALARRAAGFEGS
ncbi:MAG TPA: ROK family protein [Croceibacterium sp.]|nr:ROK family protein [Croceibacterium sp.]